MACMLFLRFICAFLYCIHMQLLGSFDCFYALNWPPGSFPYHFFALRLTEVSKSGNSSLQENCNSCSIASYLTLPPNFYAKDTVSRDTIVDGRLHECLCSLSFNIGRSTMHELTSLIFGRMEDSDRTTTNSQLLLQRPLQGVGEVPNLRLSVHN